MGRLEKTVVLVVLFLVAVVLGVALNTDDPVTPGGPGGPGGPLDASAGTPGGKQGVELARHVPASEGQPTGLLELGVEQQPAASPADAATLPSANDGAGATWILPESQPAPVGATVPAATKTPERPAPSATVLTREGLVETAMPDLMKYTWRAGDDFGALALRYFGSREEATRLQLANEGVVPSTLRPGDTIWVPVAGKSTTRTISTGAWKPGELYVVQAGDMLGSIAQKVYGSARDWRKIFNANRDLLSDPNTLRAGMKLRIPD